MIEKITMSDIEVTDRIERFEKSAIFRRFSRYYKDKYQHQSHFPNDVIDLMTKRQSWKMWKIVLDGIQKEHNMFMFPEEARLHWFWRIFINDKPEYFFRPDAFVEELLFACDNIEIHKKFMRTLKRYLYVIHNMYLDDFCKIKLRRGEIQFTYARVLPISQFLEYVDKNTKTTGNGE